MGDTLLTNLCSICHISAPKYKCPRCDIRTCSLPCIKRHKVRSDCSGVRDATAFVSRKRLATASGVDHDYNFISAIERARERSERELIEERGILREGELRPVMVEGLETRMKNGKPRKVVVSRALKTQDEMDGEGMRARLRRFGITLVSAPAGMTRKKENQTRFFKRSRRIEWFLEWFLVGEGEGNTTRVTTKMVDDLSVYEGFLLNRQTKAFGTVEWQEDRKARKESSASGPNTSQDPLTSCWLPGTSICSQNPRTGQWIDRPHEHRQQGVPEKDLQALTKRIDFYLSRPPTTSTAATTLTPIDPALKLHDVLGGTAVLEYPTLYAVERSAGIPSGFVVSSKPKTGAKRKAEDGGGAGIKRRLVEGIEDGEVLSGGAKDDEGSDSGSESESESEESSEDELVAEVPVSEGDNSDGPEPGEL